MKEQQTDLAPVAMVAKAMNVTPRRVQQLGLEGVIPRAEKGKLPVLACLAGYIRYLQSRASEGSKRLSEDARLRGTQADLRAMELERMKGEQISERAVVAMYADAGALVRQRLMSMGARIAGTLEGRTEAERKAAIDSEAISALGDLEAGLARLGARYTGNAARRRTAATKAA